MPNSEKVNNILMESVLRREDQSCFAKIYITNPLMHGRKLRKGTYIADLPAVSNHVCGILKLPDFSKFTSTYTESHSRHIGELVKIFLPDTAYTEGQVKQKSLFTRF